MLQTRRELGQTSGRTVHHAVSPAADAHGGTDGEHQASQQPPQQQEEQAEQGGRAGRHGLDSGGSERGQDQLVRENIWKRQTLLKTSVFEGSESGAL